jgi:hypothetical protein
VALARADLGGFGVPPALVVPGLPATVGDDEHLDTLLPDRFNDGLQVLDQPDLFRDLLHPRPQFAALGKEIVMGIDQQQAGPGGIIGELTGG